MGGGAKSPSRLRATRRTPTATTDTGASDAVSVSRSKGKGGAGADAAKKYAGADQEYGQYEINWFHSVLLLGTPVLMVVGLLTTELQWKTFVLGFIMYYLTGVGITAGYHRYWSHRSFKASYPVELALAVFGAAAFEGSIKWWSRNHRAHHRFTDTDKDPYNVRKGFMWAHMGWMLYKQNYRKVGTAEIGDLTDNALVRWQHRNYVAVAMLTGVVMPTLVAGLGWGDWAGGFFYAAITRMVFVHHATFCVNSLAHYIGDRPYSDLITADDSFITAILTFGEGYHNFHHEFANDYRNAVRWYQYDPTKWTIRLLAALGLTYDLKRHPDEEIAKAKVQCSHRDLSDRMQRLRFGKKWEHLPMIDMSEVRFRSQSNDEQLVVIDGVVADVSEFVDQHPGGRNTLLNYVGMDASEMFNGGSGHVHTKFARDFVDKFRVARLADDDE